MTTSTSHTYTAPILSNASPWTKRLASEGRAGRAGVEST